MRNLVRILTALVCSMYLSFLPAQTDVTSVREKLNTQFNKTKDFSVDVQLSLKMTAIRMPQKKIMLKLRPMVLPWSPNMDSLYHRRHYSEPFRI